MRWFEPGLRLGYILTGHGSLNGFLYKRGLSETNECACGAECENWKRVLIECPMYEDLGDLDAWGVITRENGSVDVSEVLSERERYDWMRMFAEAAFRRRRDRRAT